MASLSMKRIMICGLRSDRKKILEALQRQGTVEVQNFLEEDDVFQKTRMPISAAEFERGIHDAETALEVLSEYDGEKPPGLLSSFKGRDVVEKEKYDNFKNEFSETQNAVGNILKNNKEIAEKKAEILRCSQQIDMLEPWKSLDINLDFRGTESTAAFIGALPKEVGMDEVYAGIAETTDAVVDIDIISKDKEQTCIMAVCSKDNAADVSAALRNLGFSYPSVTCSNVPADEKVRLKERIDALESEIKTCEENILSYDNKKPQIKFMRDYLSIREEKYTIINGIPQSEHTFVLTGYTPEKCVPQIEKLIGSYDAVLEVADPEEGEDVPVVLKNNPFSESVQGVVESYALPLKNEIDPSFLISLFYFVFFGFMLADAAIGLLIFLGALFLLLKNKNMEVSLRRNVKLFLFGGISAIFWGIMFGSYFGDMIPVVSGEFFGKAVIVRPLWLDMTTHPMTVLALALGLGLLHIFTGMAVAAYQFLKQKDLTAFFFDVIAWYVVLIGLIIKALSMPMIMSILFAGKDPFFSDKVGNIGLYAAGVGCVALIIMAGRSSKNILKRLLKGVYAVYGITSYLSDLLSYSRLLALGLATGVISSVANMIGTMFGSGILKVIVYVIVFIIINAINIGINTLGAYVHTNRLQYVEFFGRFYDGGSRPFQPYSIKTKYYKFKETNND